MKKTGKDLPTITSASRQGVLVRLPVHGQLVDALRQMIAEGTLVAGERLQEQALAARLAVSRPPLREALRALAAEGLVELVPNRGARVVEIDARRFRDVLKVVIALEQLAPDDACRNATDAQIFEVAEAHFRMLRFAAVNDLSRYFQTNIQIHQMIVDLAANVTLSDTYRRLNNLIWRQRYLWHLEMRQATADEDAYRASRYASSIASHEQLLDALRRRDPAAMKTAISDHYQEDWINLYDPQSAERTVRREDADGGCA